MSLIESRGRRDPRRFVRLIAAGTMGLFLASATFNASTARANSSPFYGGGGGGDDDGGLSTGEKVAIAVGGAALIGGAIWYAGARRRKKKHDTPSSSPGRSSEVPALPEGVTKFSGARLVAQKDAVEAGTVCVVDLQVRSAEDGKWYTVTDREESAIATSGSTTSLVAQDGAKNAFCVPITTARSADGQAVTLVGTYTPQGAQPLTAQTTLTVRIADAS